MTWETLQAKLFHLGWLGEELPAFVAAGGDAPGGAWLFRQIAAEATTVAEIAATYVAECERAGISGPNGTTPAPPAWRIAADSRPDADTADDADLSADVVAIVAAVLTCGARDLRAGVRGGDAL
ncbi:hypothetical protein AB0N89_27770 [Amycolatopsis sp. NPDC089917]|uniref:hypothetical protein n=1 Tax=Amycolatopsis sp. NPDC089917 TaxID=3155187 RepID=UPI0034374028